MWIHGRRPLQDEPIHLSTQMRLVCFLDFINPQIKLSERRHSVVPLERTKAPEISVYLRSLAVPFWLQSLATLGNPWFLT